MLFAGMENKEEFSGPSFFVFFPFQSLVAAPQSNAKQSPSLPCLTLTASPSMHACFGERALGRCDASKRTGRGRLYLSSIFVQTHRPC